MKLSVSLSQEDVEFIDAFAARAGFPSRSAVVQRAVGMLRSGDLVSAYEVAFADWTDSGEAETWESVVADGMADNTASE